MLYLAPGADARVSSEEPARVPHFAAQFSTVRWTNIYDEDANPLIGDLISGSLTSNFGPGIAEHRVAISVLRRPRFLRRVFTHTQYWAWHDSYESAPADVEADDLNDTTLERRAPLWRIVPEHIRQLRLALRLES